MGFTGSIHCSYPSDGEPDAEFRDDLSFSVESEQEATAALAQCAQERRAMGLTVDRTKLTPIQ